MRGMFSTGVRGISDTLGKQLAPIATALGDAPPLPVVAAAQTAPEPDPVTTPATPPTPAGDDYVDQLLADIFGPRQSLIVSSPFAPGFADEAMGVFGTRARPGVNQLFGGRDNFQMQQRDFTTFPDGIDSGTSLGGTVGGMAGISGYELLDQHNDAINAAAGRWGLPANLLKSILNRESSGDWNSNAGVRTVYDEVNGGSFEILPFSGIKKATAAAWGLDWNAMIGNRELQIDGMAKILSGLASQYGGWDNAIKVYFGGESALERTYTDANRFTSDQYYQSAIDLWHELDAQVGYSGGYDGTSWGGNWASNFGSGASVHDWGEFGVDSDNGYYVYGNQYGLNGRQHTGLDITGAWNATYTSPVSGTVTCAGTGVGPGADGGGCAKFGTMDGRGGAGRIEIQLDNGAVLIFGHSQGSFVRPGQRINAGDALGTIGWANSNHIHLEARVRDSSTPSGWRIVDPRTVLGGSVGGGGGGQPGTLLERMRRWVF